MSAAEAAWKQPRYGTCQVCGALGWISRHHVFYKQHCPTDVQWDLRNAMDVGGYGACDCHDRHHTASRRIPIEKVPVEAQTFGIEVFGLDAATQYLKRRYDFSVNEEPWTP